MMDEFVKVHDQLIHYYYNKYNVNQIIYTSKEKPSTANLYLFLIDFPIYLISSYPFTNCLCTQTIYSIFQTIFLPQLCIIFFRVNMYNV
ncbi:hypothetical protein BDC45DRAFT_495929, partial [Circinella umbellata]